MGATDLARKLKHITSLGNTNPPWILHSEESDEEREFLRDGHRWRELSPPQHEFRCIDAARIICVKELEEAVCKVHVEADPFVHHTLAKVESCQLRRADITV